MNAENYADIAEAFLRTPASHVERAQARQALGAMIGVIDDKAYIAMRGHPAKSAVGFSGDFKQAKNPGSFATASGSPMRSPGGDTALVRQSDDPREARRVTDAHSIINYLLRQKSAARPTDI